MEKIDSFVFYRSFFEAAKDLKPADKATVYDAIFEYVFEKKRKKLSGICAIIMTLVTPNLDAAIANRKNGQRGGRPKKETPVPEKEKGGFPENEKPAFEKPETNGDVDVDGNGDVNADVLGVNNLPFSDPLPKVPNKKADTGAFNYSQDFEKFWAEYPKRECKKGALKKFQQIVKSGEATADQLIAGAKAYRKKVAGQNPKYTKQPTTWLNNGCWNDEAAEAIPENKTWRSEFDPATPKAQEWKPEF